MPAKQIPEVFGVFRLVEASELPLLHEVLARQLPRSRRIYDSITITLKGMESSSPIYVPQNEKGPYSGIVVTLFAEYDDPTTAISFTSSEEDAQRACQMIGDSVDWKKEIVFGAISEWHLPFLLKISAKMSSIRHCVDCPLFQKSDDSFVNVEFADNVTVRPLQRRFGTLVNNAWKFRDNNSLAWIESQCEAGLGYGAFVPGEDEPVAWILAYRYGSMGLLYTKPDFRSRGFARICVMSLSKHLYGLGVPPNVYIENDNSVSMSMFEKLGFEKMFPAAWMKVSPKENFESEA